MSNIQRSDICDNVTKSELINRLDEFVTLATRLEKLNVTPFSLERHYCHDSHVEKANKLDDTINLKGFRGLEACFQWLTIVMNEGHFEASQPTIGRITGWPQKMISLRSMTVDFKCWSKKMNIPKYQIPEDYFFIEMLNQLFIQQGDKYLLPKLEDCRSTFLVMRKKYECN